MVLSTLNRYIARRVTGGILMTFIIVISIIMLVDFVEGSRQYSDSDKVNPLDLLWLTALKTPKLIEQTIPFVVLFGVMGTLYSLNRRSELIVLRASGQSAWNFLMPALCVTTLLGIIWALAFNPLASQSMALHTERVEQLRQDSDDPTKSYIQPENEVWLREGTNTTQTVIHAQRLNILERRLDGATFYKFSINSDGHAVFSERLDADMAVLIPGGGYWQLYRVHENTLETNRQKIPELSLSTTITSEDLANSSRQQSLPPFWALPGTIDKMNKAGFSTTKLVMQFHRLLSLPLTLIAMTFIAAGVSMQLTRQGGTFRLMIMGAILGFSVYFIDSIIAAFGEAGAINAIIAAWAIPIFVLLCSVTYLSRIEDG